MKRAPVYVTRPELPPLEELVPYLERIWASRILTNSGPIHQEFERELAAHLGVEHLSLFTNGTIALITALQALGLSGEVITTPYSFVATANSIRWNGLEPVFVDVDAQTLNLDPRQLESAITTRTSAILPVHCYGHPCDVVAIDKVAHEHGLKVVYDAAHAFGVQIGARSLLNQGDCSVLSFHATKVFNTFEGGAVICRDIGVKRRVDQLRNFGIEDGESVSEPGMNGKMSELNAAIGLLQLKRVSEHLEQRREVDRLYRELLRGVRGIRILEASGQSTSNAAYFPILIGDGYPLRRDAVVERLMGCGIVARRYFYPLISEMRAYRDLPSANRALLPVAVAAADRVICLPIFPTLATAEIERIVRVIATA